MFALPGLGRLLLESLVLRDYPIIQGVVVSVGLLVMLATLAVSCALVGSVGVGMPDEYLVLDSSYLYDLSKDFASLTGSMRPLGVSMLVEHLDLMAPHKLSKFLNDVLGPVLLAVGRRWGDGSWRRTAARTGGNSKQMSTMQGLG